MDTTHISIQHDTFVILLFQKGKSLPIRPQPRMTGDKITFLHTKKRRDSADIVCLQAHITRPLATGGAALANVVQAGLKNR